MFEIGLILGCPLASLSRFSFNLQVFCVEATYLATGQFLISTAGQVPTTKLNSGSLMGTTKSSAWVTFSMALLVLRPALFASIPQSASRSCSRCSEIQSGEEVTRSTQLSALQRQRCSAFNSPDQVLNVASRCNLNVGHYLGARAVSVAMISALHLGASAPLNQLEIVHEHQIQY